MFRLYTLAPLFLCLMASLTTVKAGADLCGEPGLLPPEDRYDCLIVVDPHPISCGQLFLAMLTMQPNSYTRALTDTYGDRCCGDGPTQCLGHPGGNQGPSGYNERGPNDTCNICRNGGDLQDTYNSNGETLRYSLRYIGSDNKGFSCSEFSWLGKNGDIPNFMCGGVMSILPRYCPVCTGQQYTEEEPQQSSPQQSSPAVSSNTEEEPQQSSPQQSSPAVSSNTASSGSQCSRYHNNKHACKDAGCKYKKKTWKMY